jgi:transposase
MQRTCSTSSLNALRRFLKTCDDARACKRALAILEIASGRNVADVVELLGVDRKSVYNWLSIFVADPRPCSLFDQPRSGRPTKWRPELRDALESALADSPELYGYKAYGWTTALLQAHLEKTTGRRISGDTVRRELHRLGFAWKRPRYVLVGDPDREKKASDMP